MDSKFQSLAKMTFNIQINLHWKEFSSSQNFTNQIRYMKAFLRFKDQKLNPVTQIAKLCLFFINIWVYPTSLDIKKSYHNLHILLCSYSKICIWFLFKLSVIHLGCLCTSLLTLRCVLNNQFLSQAFWWVEVEVVISPFSAVWLVHESSEYS